MQKTIKRHLDRMANANLDLWLALLGLGICLYALGRFLAVYNQVMPQGIQY